MTRFPPEYIARLLALSKVYRLLRAGQDREATAVLREAGYEDAAMEAHHIRAGMVATGEIPPHGHEQSAGDVLTPEQRRAA